MISNKPYVHIVVQKRDFVSDSAQAANVSDFKDKNRHKWNIFAAKQEIMLKTLITVKSS